jgi:mRNA-degrading endonuclease toxin of MazEF toxin-antitoxin module
MTTQPTTWRDTLAAGDIVAFRFPCPDDPAAEKSRPCLVVAVDRIADEAVVVYGTSRRTGANRGLELHVTAPAACAEASLDRPTRFVGARRVRVPLESPRFVECRAGTAVLGRLGEAFRPRLDRLRHGGPRHARRGPWRRPGRRPGHSRQHRRPT